MPKVSKSILESMSLGELKKLTAIKEKLDALEARKATLETELAKVNKEIAMLLGGRAAPKQTTRKVTRKKRATKKATTKAGRGSKKRAAKKKVTKKAASKVPRVTVESVVVDLLKANKKPMPFADILATITKKKLVKTKSKSFDNVLRRTLSTSKVVKRVSRGVYSV